MFKNWHPGSLYSFPSTRRQSLSIGLSKTPDFILTFAQQMKANESSLVGEHLNDSP